MKASPETALLLTEPETSVLTTRVFRKITDIPFDDWNSVFQDRLTGYHLFKTLDESCLEQFSLYYAMVYDRGQPVGAASCFLMEYSLDTTIQGPLKIILMAIKKIFPRIFSLKALMCGSPAAVGHIGTAGESDRVVRAIVQSMERIAERERAAILTFKEFPSACDPMLACLQTEGFCRFESFPNTVKDLHFKNFDEYLMSLSYKTRYDLKRKFKKVDGQIKIEMEVVNDLGDSLDAAYGLYRQVLAAHDISFEILPKEFFVKLSENMPDKVRYFLWRIDGKLVTFVCCLVADGYFLDYCLGLDYAAAHEYHLYFVRFRDMMNWCIQNGIKTYEMGCTNYDPKKRLDFEFVQLNVYVKFRNKAINSHLSKFCDWLKPERFDPILKEMKSRAK